jgi:hypothetical protein
MAENISLEAVAAFDFREVLLSRMTGRQDKMLRVECAFLGTAVREDTLDYYGPLLLGFVPGSRFGCRPGPDVEFEDLGVAFEPLG